MPKWRQWETTSEADWTPALERERVVRPLDELGRPTKEGVQLAMVQLGLGRSGLYKLLRRYRQRPQTSSLLPWKRGRGSEVRCLTHAREALLQSCIREFYLKPERPSVAALAQEVKRRFSEQEFPPPRPAPDDHGENLIREGLSRLIKVGLPRLLAA